MMAGTDSGAFWGHVAQIFTAAALWAQQRAKPQQDPIEELMYRLRNPVKWTLRHPVVALKRKADRRKA